MFATILPLMLAMASPADAQTAALDAQVAEIFRPYARGMDDTAPWDRPLFSAEVTALIAHWGKVQPADEPDALNDGDWLCQCQDWDEKKFKVITQGHAMRADGSAEVTVKIDLGFDDAHDIRDTRLIFRNEGGAWKIDDLFAPEAFPKGLRQALRDTIRDDEAIAASTKAK
jgi:hypothetical protein